tara:strand:+ start:87 stop:500 length:414 start_codon:yes stop_codon:yes gene_type:complete
MPMVAGPGAQRTVQRQVFSPLDINRDGKVNLKDLKAAKTAVVSRLDQDGDGDFDFKDIQKLADNLITKNKKTCSRCGKKLKKKSKYQTGVCVECYRNPTDEERCVAVTSSGDRCQRRISDKSHKGYCGIHIRKYEAQ